MSTVKRSYNWDYLRVLASVAVVMLHVSYSYMGAIPVNGTAFTVMAAYNALTRFAVPVFFMMSGLFLLDPVRELSIKDCLKRTGRLFVIFYFWSAFYAFQGLAVDLITGAEITQEILDNSMQRFITGHGHMWFMFKLAGYYLMLPFARSISADKVALTWFCGFWMVYRFVIPFVSHWLPLGWFNMWLSQFDFNFMVSYFGYFFLGYWLKVMDIPQKLQGILYGLGILSVGGIFAFTVYDSRQMGALCEDWLTPSSFFPFVFAVSICVFFKYHGNLGTEAFNPIIRKLSQYTLLIYILHPFFIEKMNLLGINTNNYNPSWSIPLFTVLITAACVATAWVIDHIPVLNKVLLK